MKERPIQILFDAYIEGFALIPYQRMTGPGRFTKRAQRYLKNRESLAWCFRQEANKQYLYEAITTPCILSFNVHRSTRRRCDLDNLCKAISDALQSARIIENDNLIVGIDGARLFYDGKDRVVVSLRDASS